MAQVLRPLQDTFDGSLFPQVLVGLDGPDDAGVYQINAEQAIVSTLDFFPPVVDDPYTYGSIAAANALSDVYAMGGEVLFALNLAAFPDDLDRAILTEILRGGAEKVREAGAIIIGGHTVTDTEPKYGLAVTGIVHPAHILAKGGAQIGDQLILTKPLGVGLITTALKQGKAAPDHVAAAVESMSILNRHAAHLAQRFEAHACTDITGYGLLGHSLEMVAQHDASNVQFRFRMNDIPILPGARSYAEQEIFPGGLGRNRDFVTPHTTFADSIDAANRALLFEPETSGGLLIALTPDQAAAFLAQAAADGLFARLVGEVVIGSGLNVE
ncbi:MAG: selenide, water dikinase SelD [Chloroflexi bacterium]|nr:selenide, water dikinase SelD [Chloroflexota bacterium]